MEEKDTFEGMNTSTSNEDIHEQDVQEVCTKEVQSDEETLITDPDNPLNEYNMDQIHTMMKATAQIVKTAEENWKMSYMEYGMKDGQMKAIHQFNQQHRSILDEDADEETKSAYDPWNGLNAMTEEDVLEIFGEEHPIIGVSHEQTMDRIRTISKDYQEWMDVMIEYRKMHDAYLYLVELGEEAEINKLKAIMEAESDPEKKALMQQSINKYYDRKHLKFLHTKLDDTTVQQIMNTYSSTSAVDYYHKRAIDKLNQLRFSPKFLMEIYQFEVRFLPEKYHKANNLLLLYFMRTIIHADCYRDSDENRNKAISMVLALDAYIQHRMSKEVKAMIEESIMALEDQFLDVIPDPKES